MVETLITRDLPFYDPAISAPVVEALNRFAGHLGLLDSIVPYEQVVATHFCSLWQTEP